MTSEYISLLRQCHAASVEYVGVGGYAVVAHGYPRTTSGIDPFVNPMPANARRVVAALTAYGFTQDEFEESDGTTVPNFLSFSRTDA